MVSQIGTKTMTAVNFIRSAVAPEIRAAVMAAKVIWKLMKTYSLMTSSENVAAVLSVSVPVRNRLPQLKKLLPSGPKAVEYPHITQTSIASAAAPPICVMVDSMFLDRVSPP